MEGFAVVGKRLPRPDAWDKVTGKAKFTTDLKLPGMLFGKVLRSPYPHARILSLDTTRAERLPGVKAVITAQDTPWSAGTTSPEEPALAVGKARHVGDAVAAVAATDVYTAEEALDLIRVEYEPLPAVFDPEQALREGAPSIHEVEGNVAARILVERGNVVEGFLEADCVVEGRFSTPAVTHCCLETHACLASFDSSGRLTIWSSLTSLFIARRALARALGLPETGVRLIQPSIGGDFGSKMGPPQRLYFICAFLARKAGRPVRLSNTREEEFLTIRSRMPAIVEMKLGARRDGRIVAKETRIIANSGAYLTGGARIMGTTAIRHEAIYRFSNVKTEATLVYTNNPPIGSFRGLGNPQGTFPLESLLDMLAERIGMDPLELRLRNATRTGDVTVHGWEMGSCGLSECIRRAGDQAAWGEKRPPYYGLGMGCCIHVSGRKNKGEYIASAAFVRVNEDGTVHLISGEGEIGQGATTVLSQICAEELGVPLEDVRMSPADTDLVPHAANPGASKVTTIGGRAVRAAAADAKRQLFAIAAEKLEANPEDLELRERKIYVRGSPERAVSIPETVREGLIRDSGGSLVLGRGEYSLEAVGTDPRTFYGNQAIAYPFAAQVAEVKVDPETGQVEVLSFSAAHDLGKAINPTNAEGQIEGGIAQGIGYALTEELIREEGKTLNPNFVDYKIPTALDMPRIKPILVESQDPYGPFGAKGLGEPALVPTAPAIANAVYHAAGVRIRELPITPEKLLQALKEKAGSASSVPQQG